MKSFQLSLFLFFLLLTANLKSQQMVLASDVYPELKYNALRGEVFFSEYKQVKGSAYLLDDWMIGNIHLDDGNKMSQVQFKLDAFSHRIIIYQEKLKRLVIAEKLHITGFTAEINNTHKTFKKIIGVNSKTKVYDGCYFEVLTEGRVSLYKLYYKEIIPIHDANKKYIEEFSDEISYYALINDEYIHFRLGRNFLYRNFPEYKVQLRKFIRKNKLNVRKEGNIVVAVNYLNEILLTLQQ